MKDYKDFLRDEITDFLQILLTLVEFERWRYRNELL